MQHNHISSHRSSLLCIPRFPGEEVSGRTLYYNEGQQYHTYVCIIRKYEISSVCVNWHVDGTYACHLPMLTSQSTQLHAVVT